MRSGMDDKGVSGGDEVNQIGGMVEVVSRKNKKTNSPVDRNIDREEAIRVLRKEYEINKRKYELMKKQIEKMHAR